MHIKEVVRPAVTIKAEALLLKAKECTSIKKLNKIMDKMDDLGVTINFDYDNDHLNHFSGEKDKFTLIYVAIEGLVTRLYQDIRLKENRDAALKGKDCNKCWRKVPFDQFDLEDNGDIDNERHGKNKTCNGCLAAKEGKTNVFREIYQAFLDSGREDMTVERS